VRSDLAEELLTALMGWPRGEFVDRVRELEALAAVKYDEYGNFRPGMRFLESLAAWLDQFADVERADALDFVRNHLVFVSDSEMSHLIDLVYPDHIEPVLRARVARDTGLASHEISAIVARPEFVRVRRESLILGASDGSRLDRLRRSAPNLSHEQFLQSSEPPADLVAPMRKKLAAALAAGPDEEVRFRQVFLVDDFSGSGETLLRLDEGEYKGKLMKLERSLQHLVEEGVLASDYEATIVLYLASEQARHHVESTMGPAGLPAWDLRVVQLIPLTSRVSVTSPVFAALAETYYDEAMTDDHKGRAALGYADCQLPLVLAHNTPNNSVSLLWADTTGEEGGLRRRALFPRYERHHKDRP
jgi:hypothetical protein